MYQVSLLPYACFAATSLMSAGSGGPGTPTWVGLLQAQCSWFFSFEVQTLVFSKAWDAFSSDQLDVNWFG
jgi:hypothetical protein